MRKPWHSLGCHLHCVVHSVPCVHICLSLRGHLSEVGVAEQREEGRISLVTSPVVPALLAHLQLLGKKAQFTPPFPRPEDVVFLHRSG